jgi:flagellar basal-body rod protein FlgB
MKLLLDSILDRTVPGLEKAMDLTWKRNEAISSNIANAETPQYRAIDVNFAGELEKAFQRSNTEIIKTDSKHLDTTNEGMAHIVEDYSGATKPDGNNVDIDIQMGQLSYNSGKFSSAARLLRKKLGMIRFAIREAGR